MSRKEPSLETLGHAPAAQDAQDAELVRRAWEHLDELQGKPPVSGSLAARVAAELALDVTVEEPGKAR